MTRLDDRLQAGDPARNVWLPEAVTDQVLDAVKDGQEPAGRRWINRKFAAFGVAGLLLAGGAIGAGPAVAQVNSYLAQTGLFPQPIPTASDPAHGGPTAAPEPPASGTTAAPTVSDGPYGEAIPGSEWIDETASDFVHYAVESFASFPLPAGYDERHVMQAHAKQVQEAAQYQDTGQGVLEQDVGLQSQWEGTVRCLWMDDWKSSNASNNLLERAHAADIISQSVGWKATVAGDPNNAIGPYLRGLGAAAQAGDEVSVDSSFQVLNCYSTLNGIRQ
jgi:hypothetical protein